MEHEQKITVYEGTLFNVDLKSMYGSTPYCWCAGRLPEGIALFSTAMKPATSGMIAPITQSFQFGVLSVKTLYEASIEFVLTNMSNIKDVQDTYIVKLQIIPCNNSNFVPYSENEILQKYGYPCGYQDARTNKPFLTDNTSGEALKYGYPCISQAEIPYGVVHSDNSSPCPEYGYPCVTQVAKPYGVVYSDNSSPCVAYGYPCATQAAIPYGVFYSNNSDPQLQRGVKYGYPCIAETAATVKYGYPGCF